MNEAVEEAMACVIWERSAEGVAQCWTGCVVSSGFLGRPRPRFGFGAVAVGGGGGGAGAGAECAGVSPSGSLVENVGKYKPYLLIAGGGGSNGGSGGGGERVRGR